MWVYGGESKGHCDREMEKTKPPGHSRPSVMVGARHRSRKKRRDRERGWGEGCIQQVRATVKGRERAVIVGAVMRLDLGFRKVRREKGGMLTQDQNSHVDLIT